MRKTILCVFVASLVAPPAGAQVFIGTGGYGGATQHDGYDVDETTGTATSVFSSRPVELQSFHVE
jgi:hypothetical protein